MKIKELLRRARIGEIKRKRVLNKTEEKALVRAGYMMRRGTQRPTLTPRGKKKIKVVLTGGVFDLLHLGHVNALEKAKKQSDLLVVAVAHDQTVKRVKGRPPLHTAKQRAALLEKLRCVDAAIVGHPTNKKITVRRVEPDVVVFGYDQRIDMKLKAKIRRLKTRKKGKFFKTANIIAEA
ncbi:FAD synthase [Candidatus Micrarchaeota archaeon]|nr:MAG: FAD synthase [Candidatus Micrarchaeota archaeon]